MCGRYQGGIVLDLMRMKDFVMHEAEMQATVQPGIKKSELNEKLEPYATRTHPPHTSYGSKHAAPPPPLPGWIVM